MNIGHVHRFFASYTISNLLSRFGQFISIIDQDYELKGQWKNIYPTVSSGGASQSSQSWVKLIT
jgi:hypothetical protein